MKKRLRDIGEARIAIEEALSSAAGLRSARQAEARAAKLPWAVAAALGLALVALGVWFWRATRPVERPLVRLDVDLGSEVALLPLCTGSHNVILSPDGSRLVYVSGAPPRLYHPAAGSSQSQRAPGHGGGDPTLLFAGRAVGGVLQWRNGNKLNKISVEGGAVVPLADLSGTIGASWGADGNIIVGGVLKGLLRVPAGGGAPTTVLEWASGDRRSTYSRKSCRGAKRSCFRTGRRDADTNSIEVFSFADRRRKTLVRGGYSGRYLPSGHLVYANKGTLFAIPFDVDKLETRGTAVPVLDDVAYEPGNSGVDLDFAGTGTLVYRRGTAAAGVTGMATIQWVDAAGKKDPLRAKPGAYRSPQPLSRRQTAVAFGGWGSERCVGVRLAAGRDDEADVRRGSLRFPDLEPGRPVRLFRPHSGGDLWTRADGAGQPQPLTESKVSSDSIVVRAGRQAAGIFRDSRKPADLDAPAGGAGRAVEGGEARAVPEEPVRRLQSGVLARRTLAGLCVERAGEQRGVRAGLSAAGLRGKAASGRSRTAAGRGRGGRETAAS